MSINVAMFEKDPIGELIAETTIPANFHVQFNCLWPERGIRPVLSGKTGAEAEPILREAIATLGTTHEEPFDIFRPTDGNAGARLLELLGWAICNPSGIFELL